MTIDTASINSGITRKATPTKTPSQSVGEINREFARNGLLVTRINDSEENLEDYFSKLIGGGGIA